MVTEHELSFIVTDHKVSEAARMVKDVELVPPSTARSLTLRLLVLEIRQLTGWISRHVGVIPQKGGVERIHVASGLARKGLANGPVAVVEVSLGIQHFRRLG